MQKISNDLNDWWRRVISTHSHIESNRIEPVDPRNEYPTSRPISRPEFVNLTVYHTSVEIPLRSNLEDKYSQLLYLWFEYRLKMSVQLIHNIQSLLGQLQERIQSAENKDGEKDNRTNDIKEVANMKSAVGEMRKALGGVEAQNKVLEASIEKMKGDLLDWKTENQWLKAGITYIESVMEANGKGLVQLNEEISSLRSELAELKATFTDLQPQAQRKEETARFDGLGGTLHGGRAEKIPHAANKSYPQPLSAEDFWRKDRLKECETEDDTTENPEHESRTQQVS